MSDENENTGLITTGQAARLLMVSEVRVRQLSKMEYIQKASRGRFNLVTVVQGYIRYLKDDERRSSKSASASRLQDVKVLEAEMRMAEKRRELIPIEEATAVLDVLLGALRSELAGLPAQYTRDAGERDKLEALVNGAINRIADVHAASAETARSGGDLPSAD